MPTAWDVLGYLVSMAWVALTVAALISLGRCRSLSAGQTLAWASIVLFVPLFGAVAWLAASRRLGGAVSG